MRSGHDHHQHSSAFHGERVPLGTVGGPKQIDVSIFDHATIHAEDKELGQVIRKRQQTFDRDKFVSHEYHVERGQAEIQGAEEELQKYDVAIAVV